VKYLALMIAILYFLYSYEKYSETKENKEFFKNEKLLKCFSGGGLYSEANRYRVSKKNGWNLEGDYFIKDSLMIRANKCERL